LAPAHAQFCAIFKQDSMMAVKPGLDLLDTVDIDDSEAMYPEELRRVELDAIALNRTEYPRRLSVSPCEAVSSVLGGFLDVRPAIYARGSGMATLRNFRY
jgi:hypothetical protein